MAEPEFIRQCNDPMTQDQRREWIEKQVAEGKEQGLVLGRVSIHPTLELTLFEGWKEQPEDQGEPRFQLADKKDSCS